MKAIAFNYTEIAGLIRDAKNINELFCVYDIAKEQNPKWNWDYYTLKCMVLEKAMELNNGTKQQETHK